MAVKDERVLEVCVTKGKQIVYTISQNTKNGNYILRDRVNKIIAKGDPDKVMLAKEKYKISLRGEYDL